MGLINRITRDTARAIHQAKRQRPLSELKRRIRDGAPVRSLSRALGRFGMIAEIKEKSPSVGPMAPANIEAALSAYEACDAVVGISILTQVRFFGGSMERLGEVRRKSTKPILRKDFIFDEYQVYEARAFGADAILLMASLPIFKRHPRRLKELFALATDLKMECLCEIGMASSGEDLEAIAARVPGKARLWGVNARRFSSSWLQLKQRLGLALRTDLITDIRRHKDMRYLVPSGKIAIAESGIHDGDELIGLFEMGYSGALIGTALLKGPATVEDVLSRFTPAVRTIRARQRSERESVRVSAQG